MPEDAEQIELSQLWLVAVWRGWGDGGMRGAGHTRWQLKEGGGAGGGGWGWEAATTEWRLL